MTTENRKDFDAHSLRFAAIDIGSNAMRLLLSRVFNHNEQPTFIKESLIRIPIRLGAEAFTKKQISWEKADKLMKTMQAFKLLIDAYQPIKCRACATSAMREAKNGEEIVNKINSESGIKLEIVNGKREAEIIYSNRSDEKINKIDAFIYIDVGGGSTELTIISRNNNHISMSFDIGTVRLLEGLVSKKNWAEMKSWIKKVKADYQPTMAIGSGGNINKIFRLAMQKVGKPLSYKKLKKIYKELLSYSYEDRIKKLGLRPDRADVIIPASEIYLSVLKWAGIPKISVPQVGLADGLVHILFEEHKRKSNEVNE